MEFLSYSENDTTLFARSFARKLAGGDVVLLRGKLGAGKSVFAREMIRTLCGDASLEVPSPTFTLVQTYESAKGEIWHFDLYRLKDPDEVYEIGWEEALAGGIVLVEWPERLGALTPAKSRSVNLTMVQGEPDSRLIEVVEA